MARGGARPGAGRKKGYKEAKTLEKEAARAALREMVIREMGPMTDAQIAHAKGISYLVLRNPDGTYTRATDQESIDRALAAGDAAFRVFTQAPNPQAYKDLMDRALDKPAEQVQVTGADGGPVVFSWEK